MRIRLTKVATLLLILPATMALAETDAPEGASADEPSKEQIEQWVVDLNADQYDVRDTATQGLVSAGPAALEAVIDALSDNGLETTTRAIFILQRLALSGDLDTEQAARVALEEVAADRVTAAARRAAEALESLADLKQKQALKQLEELGARVDPDYVEVGLAISGSLAVEIGEQFEGTEADLRRLKWLQDVEQITFVGQRVTDRWVAHVEGMESLTTLKIKEASISSAALEPLGGLPNLRYVKLLYVPVGNDAVEQLQKCERISRVLAYGTEMTAEGAQKLAAHGVDVDRRQGAFLGISVPRANEGENWFIDAVTENSAASKAGLRPGDVIIQYDDRDVKDFVALMEMISENDAGDTVTLHVRRGSRVLVKEITFGQWE